MNECTTDRRVAILKALAHPARLQLVEVLAAGERCVSELQQAVGGDISTVSKHLARMRQAGWIACRKQGLQVRYRLTCDCLPTFLRCIEDVGRGGPSDCDC
jgi:ArsR family transcriptional regulator